jgi:hypothetical protein
MSLFEQDVHNRVAESVTTRWRLGAHKAEMRRNLNALALVSDPALARRIGRELARDGAEFVALARGGR